MRRQLVARLLVTAALTFPLVVAGAVTGLVGSVPAGAATSVPVPKTPTGLPAVIESTDTPYVPQDSCWRGFRPGTQKLINLLAATYPDVYAQGAYACGTDGTPSEHYEGRAIDWMASVRNPTEHAEAKAFIGWLLATDKAGNKWAMARRLGVMYLIYDNRIWGSWDHSWQPYNNCAKTPGKAYDNACHRTHVHISLTWDGAMGRSSFWSKRVPRDDYGPCPAAGMSLAGRYIRLNPKPCPTVPAPATPKGASGVLKALEPWSGAYLYYGYTGPLVVALQNALNVPATGNFLSQTRAAVVAFQTAHKVPPSGRMYVTTWRALLAALAPRG